MSDEQAAVRDEEIKQQQQIETQTQEEIEKRSWMVILALDPVTGKFQIEPNENITKTYEVELLLNMGLKKLAMTDQANMTQQVLMKVFSEMARGPKGKPGR